MSTIIIKVYDAFKEAGVSEERPIAAARALADYENHFGRIESILTDVKAEIKIVKAKIEIVDKEISLLKWMLGFGIAGIISLIVKSFLH